MELTFELMRAIGLEGNNAPITHLIYSLNSSYTPTLDLLRYLELKGLVVPVGKGARTLYRLTPDGIEIVNAWDLIKARLGADFKLYNLPGRQRVSKPQFN